MGSGGPPGWPRDLPPPTTEEFSAKVTGWLLDRGPADLRLSPIRQWPVALARLVANLVEAELVGTRRAYANARVDLSRFLAADEVASVQSALEAEGARLITMQREIALVEEALRR